MASTLLFSCQEEAFVAEEVIVQKALPQLSINGDLDDTKTFVDNYAIYSEAKQRFKPHIITENGSLIFDINGEALGISSELFRYIKNDFDRANKAIVEGKLRVELEEATGEILLIPMEVNPIVKPKFFGDNRIDISKSNSRETLSSLFSLYYQINVGDDIRNFIRLDNINWHVSNEWGRSVRGYSVEYNRNNHDFVFQQARVGATLTYSFFMVGQKYADTRGGKTTYVIKNYRSDILLRITRTWN